MRVGGSGGKESAWNAEDPGMIPGSGRSPGGREWLPTLVFFPGKTRGQSSLVESPQWLSGKASACNAGDPGFLPWVRKIPRRKAWATHSSTLVWRIPWTEKPAGYGPQDQRESQRTEVTEQHTHCNQKLDFRNFLIYYKLFSSKGMGLLRHITYFTKEVIKFSSVANH